MLTPFLNLHSLAISEDSDIGNIYLGNQQRLNYTYIHIHIYVYMYIEYLYPVTKVKIVT